MDHQTIEPEWPEEHIPDTDQLYFRVHRQYVREDGTVGPSAFEDRGAAMSTDWAKYSTPMETRNRASRNPGRNGVVSLHVGLVRAIPQVVRHSPIAANRAHSDVVGEKSTEARAMLRRIATWEVPVAAVTGP